MKPRIAFLVWGCSLLISCSFLVFLAFLVCTTLSWAIHGHGQCCSALSLRR